MKPLLTYEIVNLAIRSHYLSFSHGDWFPLSNCLALWCLGARCQRTQVGTCRRREKKKKTFEEVRGKELQKRRKNLMHKTMAKKRREEKNEIHVTLLIHDVSRRSITIIILNLKDKLQYFQGGKTFQEQEISYFMAVIKYKHNL